MKFMYHNAKLPEDKNLLIKVNLAANRLFKKLKKLDLDSLDISEYNKRYFGDYLKNLKNALMKYVYILSWSITSSNIAFNKFVFIDYGGGSGMLSLLAKECKIGTVIYNDIYDISCRDAKVIGEAIGNQADYYVQGDIDDVIRFLKTNSISCNAIASYDVIEHIYDIRGFLGKLHLLSNNSLNVVMSSGANNLNPEIKEKLIKTQLYFEYIDREEKWGHKKRDCLSAYLKVREEMIRNYALNLNKTEIRLLALATRGMIEFDIKKCVDKYTKAGKLPKGLSHPSNTCDPYTGNWAEHLMDPFCLVDILSKKGFKATVLSSSGFSKDVVKELTTASFFTLYGRKKKKD